MTLVQNMSPKRIYLGVFFPQGVPVELPADFPEDQVQTLLSWGWMVVEVPAVVEEAPDEEEAPAAPPARSPRASRK